MPNAHVTVRVHDLLSRKDPVGDGERVARFRDSVHYGLQFSACLECRVEVFMAFACTVSAGRKSLTSPTMPKWATLKIDAFGSLLTATIVLAPSMPSP